MHGISEPVADLGQGYGRQPQLLVDGSTQTGGALKPGDVGVGVHPGDALDLENHMIAKDIGNTAR